MQGKVEELSLLTKFYLVFPEGLYALHNNHFNYVYLLLADLGKYQLIKLKCRRGTMISHRFDYSLRDEVLPIF